MYKRETLSVVALAWSDITDIYNTPDIIARDRMTNWWWKPCSVGISVAQGSQVPGPILAGSCVDCPRPGTNCWRWTTKQQKPPQKHCQNETKRKAICDAVEQHAGQDRTVLRVRRQLTHPVLPPSAMHDSVLGSNQSFSQWKKTFTPCFQKNAQRYIFK